jgi:hypothetical protein
LEPARRLRLIILDACRDNPFVRTVRRTSETRSIGRGLGKIETTPSDTLIAYAAKAGSTAADGDAEHSPFTTALLKNLTAPGLDLRIALGRVRDDVIESTGNKQEPFVYGSLGGATVSLVPEGPASPPAAVAATPPVFDAKADARRDYELAAQVDTKETWDSFLAIHGTGFYADLARGQRNKLLAAESKVATRSPPAVPQTPKAADPAQEAAPSSAPATVLGSVEPTASPPKAGDPAEVTRRLHTELKRLGCYLGATDASWSSDSRRALAQFNKHAREQLNTRVASLDALSVVRTKTGRVCPLECRHGYRADNDACVKIVCRSGFAVGEDGQCERERERKPKAKTASRPDTRGARTAAPRNQGEAPPEQIVCGRNGCLNVPRGCRGERIAAGQGEQAAVICN